MRIKPLLVIYATHYGHTRRIAEYVASVLKAQGFSADLVDVAHLPANFSLELYSGTILAAGVYRREHERQMMRFIKKRLSELARIPTAFLSISLSQAGVEDASASPERRAQAAGDVDKMIQSFMNKTGWRPNMIKPLAGSITYSKYNFFLRFVMKGIARKAGGGTDTSRDYDYTDWKSVDRLVSDFTSLLSINAAPTHPQG